MNAKERTDMTAPPEPQPVLNPLTRAAIFLVVAVGEGGEPTARDLLGDVDGTESPSGQAGMAAAIADAGDPGFAGGSYLIVQRYVHDMGAWNALTVEEQERVIGRTKLDDIELPDDVKPSNSHVAVN